MARYQVRTTVRHPNGTPAPLHVLTFYTDSTMGTEATLYVAGTGVTEVANPYTTDSSAIVDFWTEDTTLWVLASGDTSVRPVNINLSTGRAPANVMDYGAAGDGQTDDTAAIQDAAQVNTELYFPAGIYKCNSALFASVPVVDGLHWTAERGPHGDSADGTVIKYTGSGVCFEFLEAVSAVTERGSNVFENFTFQATNAAGTMFEFNDPSTSADPYDAGTPGYIRGIHFRNCAFWGGSGSGDAIRSWKTFELTTDEACYVRDWRRGAWLKASDNNTLAGRFNLNCRNIVIEGKGQWGNDNVVSARYSGVPKVGGSESGYCIWDSGQATTILNTGIEIAYGLAGVGMYFNGYGTRVVGVNLMINVSTPWELGPDAKDIVFMSMTTAGALGTPIWAAATSYDWSATHMYPGVTIVDSTEVIDELVFGLPRHRVSQSVPRFAQARIDGEVVTAQGLAQKRMVITPTNFSGQSVGLGYQVIGGIVVDAASFYGSAIEIAAVNNSGFSHRQFVCGQNIHEGDTIKVTLRYRMSSVPASGTFICAILKNLGWIGVGASISASTTYTTYTVSYTLSGFTAGDFVDVVVYNNATTDATLKIECLIIEVCDAPNVDTSGANLATLETEVNQLKATLRRFGILG